MTSSVSSINNPFTRPTFWGREKELDIIASRLLGDPPQSIVIIGEPYIGKTGLVRRLMQLSLIDNAGAQHSFTFVYLDCALYLHLIEDQSAEESSGRDMGNFAAARFWWDLFHALPDSLRANETFPEPKRHQADTELIDAAYEIKSWIEECVRAQHQPIIFIFDNFEGLARLPLRNSQWLRAMAVQTENCAYVATSRYILYLLYSYHPQSWQDPSPLWNIFSDPIYLGLLTVNEVETYLAWVATFVESSNHHWCEQDTAFIREMAGRHPELLRMACARLLEYHLSSQSSSGLTADERDYTFLRLRLAQDAAPLCNQLWHGLTNPELYNLPGSPGSAKKEKTAHLSPYQRTLIEIAHQFTAQDKDQKVLFELEQRGLIERIKGEWHVVSGVMREFVLSQEQIVDRTSAGATAAPDEQEQASASTFAEKEDDKPLTYKEGKVYEYLKARLGEVCDRTEIMQAVWGDDNLPSSSALQKIIERIRDKIEDDPDSPYKLIAVRGRGYMLRKAL